MRLGLYAAAVVAALGFTLPAHATAIAPVGTTDVTVTSDFLGVLTGSGISAAPIEGATANGATFSFNITGGNLDTLVIEHSGGVEFSLGSASLTATNFLIDGGAGIVSANVNGGSAFLPLFDLANVSLSGPITAELVVNDILSNAIVDTFLGGDATETDTLLSNAIFAVASTAPAPVPLPASAVLLVAGLGGLAALRRKSAQG